MKILITGGSGFIGTNLIELFLEKKISFLNFDKNIPKKKDHIQYWFKGNLLDRDDLKKAIDLFNPTIIIHLAAKTDTSSDNLKDYIDNTEGTKNLISIIENTEDIDRVIITSSQYVYKSSIFPFPFADDDYNPYTTYGISKKITEELTRNSSMSCAWTIIRPCNVWGPWNMRYPNELWRIIHKGLYKHPTRRPVIRTYAYVKNVTHQINAILSSEKSKVNKKTYYLGDLPIDSYHWLNELSFQLRNKPVTHLPIFIFYPFALIGDFLKRFNVKAPLTQRRLNNMVENYYAPTNITIKEFGLYSNNLSDCMRETNSWLVNIGIEYFDYWKKIKIS